MLNILIAFCVASLTIVASSTPLAMPHRQVCPSDCQLSSEAQQTMCTLKSCAGVVFQSKCYPHCRQNYYIDHGDSCEMIGEAKFLSYDKDPIEWSTTTFACDLIG